ncbi:type III polyketide synthase [Alteribacillus sp. HJP-4]|uniref:type III polyketide synthase n=1 Tax=Alteribacillus sp. HJP-4 TaxID=2775394 RepID=UPI0035CD0E6C
MPFVECVITENAPYKVRQEETEKVVEKLFSDKFQDIQRLMKVFKNTEIQTRYFAAPLEWFEKEHGLEEKNTKYVTEAVRMGSRAVQRCMEESKTNKEEIEAIIFVSSSGMATPTIDARIMNELDLPEHIKRIPLWGLGCAGGAAGLSRAHEYCLAYPEAKVLLLCIELCSLTLQRGDFSKSNLIGTSLFADGCACTLVAGEQAANVQGRLRTAATYSTLMPHSEDVMGWEVKDEGLHVVFSRDIPSIVENWLKPNVDSFMKKIGKTVEDITHFVAHPGGKKVLGAYETSLQFDQEKTETSRKVLASYGNMSSPTVLYVLKQVMENWQGKTEQGLLTALGPGFCSEMLWLEWKGDEGA